MSGHNKWSKIKHKKAATDAQKSKVFSKHANLIAVAAKKANGDINSPGLQAAIERAKKDSMPKNNIERAVSKGSGVGGALLTEVLYETYGPGGVAIIIAAVTDNSNRTTPEIKHTLSKFGYQLGNTGSSVWAFVKTTSEYTPTTLTKLNNDDEEKLTNLIEALKEHEDVHDVYTTVDSVK